MSLLLLVAALVSLFALREPIDAAAISAMVILNITVAVVKPGTFGPSAAPHGDHTLKPKETPWKC